MISKIGKYFKVTGGYCNQSYIIGRVTKDCNLTYKYELIKSNYYHSPKSSFYILWKSLPYNFNRKFTWYENKDELMVEML